jgi:hypothetical protein
MVQQAIASGGWALGGDAPGPRGAPVLWAVPPGLVPVHAPLPQRDGGLLRGCGRPGPSLRAASRCQIQSVEGLPAATTTSGTATPSFSTFVWDGKGSVWNPIRATMKVCGKNTKVNGRHQPMYEDDALCCLFTDWESLFPLQPTGASGPARWCPTAFSRSGVLCGWRSAKGRIGGPGATFSATGPTSRIRNSNSIPGSSVCPSIFSWVFDPPLFLSHHFYICCLF